MKLNGAADKPQAFPASVGLIRVVVWCKALNKQWMLSGPSHRRERKAPPTPRWMEQLRRPCSRSPHLRRLVGTPTYRGM